MTSQELTSCIEGWQNKSVLVIGDAMLDIEIHTRYQPKSREVGPILKEQQVHRYPGGAANVAMNLKVLGAHVSLLAPIGSDSAGTWLRGKLKEERIGLEGEWMAERKRWLHTTSKTRVFRDGREFVCRIDRDAWLALPAEKVWTILENGLHAELYDLVVFSDYQKGAFETPPQLYLSRLLCKGKRPFLTLNVKPATTAHVQGADLLTLNEQEYWIVQQANENSFTMAERLGVGHLIQTQGHRGLSITHSGGGKHLIHPHPVVDVDPVGAGDAVLAAASLALLTTQDPKLIGEIANAAGAAKCAKHGTLPVRPEDLLKFAARRVEDV